MIEAFGSYMVHLNHISPGAFLQLFRHGRARHRVTGTREYVAQNIGTYAL